MPNSGSWNGKWTGDGNFYARCRTVSPKLSKVVLNDQESRSFYYNFGDGWGANVEVKKVTSAEKKKIEKNSKGFCGYEWMIDSIIQYDTIIDSSDIKKNKTLIQEMFEL
jgi:hypothetical protein